jgi:glycosyltransferase involved in cell wall biosynthesis
MSASLARNPLVSIIMPVFNEELHLEKCLNSIINQTYGNWELIAIDDFSRDRSPEILTQFQKKDSRIRALKNNEKGIIPALAKAFSLSTGEFISRMDADDYMPDYKIQDMVTSLFPSGEKSIVTGKVEYFSDGVLQGGFIRYAEWLNNLCEQGNHWDHIYKECVIPSACWMARKKDLESINAFTKSQYPEDYDLVFRFYQHQFKVIPITKRLHYWRDHPGRASRNDPNYLDQKFYDLKLKYFFEIERDEKSPLFIWGAGRKGKILVSKLIKEGYEFRWLSDNNKKVGKHIYHIPIESPEVLINLADYQIIIAISAKVFHKDKEMIFNKYRLMKEDAFEFF